MIAGGARGGDQGPGPAARWGLALAPAVVAAVAAASNAAGLLSASSAIVGVAALSTLWATAIGVAYARSAARLTRHRRALGHDAALFAGAPTAMIIADGSGRIGLVNAEAERLFGYPPQAMNGLEIEALVPGRLRGVHVAHRASYATHPVVRPMGTGKTLHGLRRDGTEFPAEVSLGPVESPDGAFVVAAIRDVTERFVFEQTLREQHARLEAALRSKNRFLARMSHELRTPLNAIIGFTGTLLMRLPGPLTGDQEKQLTLVRSSGQHLLSIINDLLDLAQIESDRVRVGSEPVSCREVVAEVKSTLEPLAAAKGLALDASTPEPDVIVKADRRAMVQILVNLVGNGIKFTSTGGVSISVNAGADDGMVELSVRDTGIGLPDDARARLFDEFARLHAEGSEPYEGTGLGLHISQKLAGLLGGRITFHSDGPGHGSRFTLHVPKGA
ncbi:MAG: PAS domain-containing sensor histidine kinase [Vicinamibacterales bacterium]